MVRLLKILGVSLGAGVAVGAGMRIGDALARRESVEPLNSAPKAAGGNSQASVAAELAAQLRMELRSWIEDSVRVRMDEIEARLRLEEESRRKQTLDALVESVQSRVIHRITHLEGELATQSAAMTQLRELSWQTERRMQELLGRIDLLILEQRGRQSPEAAPTSL